MPLPVESIRDKRTATVLRFTDTHPRLHFLLCNFDLWTVVKVVCEDEYLLFNLD